MALPQPAQFQNWQDWASALIRVLSVGTGDVVASSVSGGPAGSYVPAPYVPLWFNSTSGDLYQGNVLGTFPPAPDIVFIDTANIADAAIETAKIDAGAITEAALASGSVTNPKLADGSVGTTNIIDLAVATAKIADLAVLTAKIADAAIVSAKIGDLQVVTAKIADLAVNNAKIANLAVDTANIVDAAINNAKIGLLAVGSANIILASIGSAQISDASIATADIGAAQITNALMANASIGSAQIINASIQTADIGNAQILSALIGNAQIVQALIAAAAVGTAQIIDASIIAAKIGDAEVGTIKIQDQAVTFPVSAYTTASITVPSGGAWTAVQTCTINATGAPIEVIGAFQAGPFDFSYSSFVSGIANYRLTRDGTVIWGPCEVGYFNSSGALRGTGSNVAVASDQPAAGNHTYKLECQLTPASGGSLAPVNRSLFVIETKK